MQRHRRTFSALCATSFALLCAGHAAAQAAPQSEPSGSESAPAVQLPPPEPLQPQAPPVPPQSEAPPVPAQGKYLDCERAPEVPVPEFAQLVEQQLGPVPVQSIGPIASTMLGQLLDHVCARADLTSLLPNTCAAGVFDIAQLRVRLLIDLARVPQAYAQQTLNGLPDAERAALGLLAGVVGKPDPASVAQRVAVSLGYASGQSGAVEPACVVPQVNTGDEVSVAVLLFWRLSQNPDVAVLRARAETEAIIERTLLEQGVVVAGAITPPQRALITRLAEQTSALHQHWLAVRATFSLSQLSDLIGLEAAMLEAALSLSHSDSLSLPFEAIAAARALAAANIDQFVTELGTWLVARERLAPEVVDTAEVALRFAGAEDEAEARRILRGALLGLDSWTDNWIAGASVGIPRLKSGDTNVALDGTLGYSASRWGALARGGVSVFDLDSPSYVATTLKVGANADAWLAFEIGDNSAFEVRGTFDFTVFDTDTQLNDADANLLSFATETSALIRGGALAGFRTQAPGWALGVWAGGGFQLESYDSLAHDPGTNDTESLDNEAVGGAFEGRLRGQYSLVQDVLMLRAALDWKFYKLSRLTEAIAARDLVELDTEALQIEAIGRAFLDVEALRFFEFVPGVGVGADHYELAVNDQDTQVSTIPVFLFGIRRAVF